MNDRPTARPAIDDADDIGHNPSANPHFDDLLRARLSRRTLLRGSGAGAAVAVLAGTGLSACGGGAQLDPIRQLDFSAVAKGLTDTVSVPPGYRAEVLFALGDPLKAGVAPFKNDGTHTDFQARAGDHHDGMELFPLDARGRPSDSANDRAVLAINHEATTDERLSSFFVFANGGTQALPRPAAEVDVEVALHGLSFVEVLRERRSGWRTQVDSVFNRRVTPLTLMEVAGPARGDALLRTRFAPGGAVCRGTLNNCGTGRTPWGTVLSGEENFAGYFTRGAADDAARGNDKSVTALRRYGRAQGAASRHGWETGGSEDRFARWNLSKTGSSTDGSDDYRNEMNSFGYLVEIDPYDASRAPKKRTALGRFAHESAAFSLPRAGRPLAVYMGDDARNEYIYKFVSKATWREADARARDRRGAGDRYLDEGTLYVARFDADGSGRWIELSTANPQVAGATNYPFANQADVCVHARLAADAVGATRMDRPEWCATNPVNGEVYFTLTNNSNRRVEPASGTQSAVDAANPRAYSDARGSTTQQGNVNGHIIRLAEDGDDPASLTFRWDVFLFGAEAGADPGKVNLSNLGAEQDFSSPDGLWFSPSTGLAWIQTDDGAYTDVTNCMMLAAVPGAVGDGETRTLSYPLAAGGTREVTARIGAPRPAALLKRFLVGPVGCEITGICETPDGRTMFVNIQHPGENTAAADIGDPTRYTSHWPGNAGYGAGGALARPRSATIVITKDDGGRIGS